MSELTVLGNLSVDHVDGGAPSPGGAPAFAVQALKALGAGGRVLARMAPGDQPLFAELLEDPTLPVTVLPAVTTSAFDLLYSGESRALTVDAIGEPWTAADIEAAAIDTTWVHVAPLLRSDFPPDTLARLASAGHRVSYDGQGLVRVPGLGPLKLDGDYDPALLRSLSVLKLSEEEARVVACRVNGAGSPGSEPDVAARDSFTVATAARLGVGEILVTLGCGGCDLYAEGRLIHVPAKPPVHGIQATGAGDAFAVAYAASRAAGEQPAQAAGRASELVAAMLSTRRRARAS